MDLLKIDIIFNKLKNKIVSCENNLFGLIMHYLDVSIVIIYLAACIFFGLYKSKKIKNIREYTLGDKGFSTLILVVTIFATAVNATTTVGKAGIVYNSGLIYGIPSIMIGFAWIFTSIIFAKNIECFKGCISISEIMEVLYGKLGLSLSVICVLIDSISLITIQITAIGFLFKYFFQIPYELGIFLAFGILTFYSVIGGIRAVAYTDLLQFMVFFIAFPTALGILYHEIGGYKNIISTLPKSYFSIFSEDGTIWLFMGYMLYYLLPSISAPNIQRILIAKSKYQLSKACIIVSILFPIFSLIVVILSICIKVHTPELEANTVLYYFIDNYLPYGAIGLMISGMLAVMMSTADSWLNCAGSTIAHDLMKKLFPNTTEQKELIYARITTIFIAVISVFIALKIQKILEVVWMTRNFIFPIIYVPFVAGILGFRTNLKSFLAGIVLGVACCWLGWFYTGQFGIISLCLGKLGSAIGLFGMHLLQVKHGSILLSKKQYILRKVSLRKKFVTYLEKIKNIKQQIEDVKSTYFTFALIVLLTNIPPSILYHYSSNEMLDWAIRLIRVASTLLCFCLYCYEYWLPESKDYFITWFWNFCLLFCLSLSPSFMIIISNLDAFWVIYFILCMMLLSFFTHWLLFVPMLVIGFVLASILYLFINYLSGHHVYINNVLEYNWYPVYSCSVIILISAWHVYSKLRSNKDEKMSLTTLSMSIAHEVITPLSIGLAETRLIKEAINEKDYEKAKQILYEQEHIIKRGLQDVDTILSSVEIYSKPKDWREHSVITAVTKTLQNSYLTDKERDRITFIDAHNAGNDFFFIGSENLFEHVIYNIIRNAIKYAGEGANIKIWLSNNKLHIKDSGKGMSSDTLNQIFKGHYNKSKLGYGIGLSFCQEAMKKMKGQIECLSEIGKGTEFILSF